MLKLNLVSYSVLLAFLASYSAIANESNSLDLSLQELLNVEVTSVSKQKQSLSNSPASQANIFVIQVLLQSRKCFAMYQGCM
jgi:iron complex outermembrane receptor protein